METVQKVEKSGNTLFNHMFSDENTKPNIVNIMQYTAIGIIPVLVLNRLMQHIIAMVWVCTQMVDSKVHLFH